MNKNEELRKKTLDDLRQIHGSSLPPAAPTKVLADLFNVEPGTIRRSLCVNGSYLALTPVKLPNGRLIWPLT